MTTMGVISVCDLVITVAYFSIPLQLLVSLWKSPPHRKIPKQLILTLLLFAAFIFLCGSGHLMRFFGMGHTNAFVYVNVATALVSLTTALYLIPLIPCMFSLLDESINKLTNETKESKSKLFTFMAFLCHEIRNPLFAITSSAEFLKDTSLRPDQAEEVSSICDSSLLMLRLVNDVLDLSKLDSGKLELESREFDLHSMLRRLGDNMKRQVDRKHKGAVHLSFELAKDVPRVIFGDSTRILQIVYNLLSNSIKFTSQGKIDLVVKLANPEVERQEEEEARRSGAHIVHMSSDRQVAPFSSDLGGSGDETPPPNSGEDNQLFSMALLGGDSNEDIESGGLPALSSGQDMMLLSVTVGDTGIGIPSERLATIFEPYTQAKLSDFRQHGGTGLGLSIISSLIKTMGGNVSVTSKAGEGSRFHLKIPVRVPRDPTVTVDENVSDSCDADSNQTLDSRRLPIYEDVAQPGITLPLPPGVQRPASTFSQSGSQANGPMDLLSGPHPSYVPEVKLEEGRSQRRNSICQPSKQTPSLPKFDFLPQSNLVLVVDDNSVNRKILGKMLSTYNIEYETASNGREAVDALLASRNATGDLSRPQFGLVFMDVSMPVMDGNAAIKAIREAKITVPIVALSANVLTQERDRTICLGANESHTKPILRADLHQLCTKFLYKAGEHQNMTTSSPEFQARQHGLFSKSSSSSGSSATDSESSTSS